QQHQHRRVRHGHDDAVGDPLAAATGGCARRSPHDGGGWRVGFAAVLERSNLHLWSKSMDQWEHLEDVRDLKTLLPRGSISMMNNVLIGFADGGVRVVVVRLYHGPFIVELGSTGPARVALRRSGIYAVFPYTSFCTPAAATTTE
uniref:Uncharacterized protein n=1 Tax=Oryza glaberrima TaxID=4538 RepID=I1Q172_ORYGL